jgi:hypothetical protein
MKYILSILFVAAAFMTPQAASAWGGQSYSLHVSNNCYSRTPECYEKTYGGLGATNKSRRPSVTPVRTRTR